MIFDDNTISSLRYEVKQRLSEKRYKHTLGVEKMARALGEILIPEKIDELSVAALLHDIAKEMTYEDHLKLISESSISYSDDDLATRPALHSFAAAPVVQRDFPEYATKDILSAVTNHTLGAPNMSVFDEIIFISDYAEEGRTYYSCIEVNRNLFDNLRSHKPYDENIRILHEASLKAVRSTISSLSVRKEKINTRTMLTKQYLEEKLDIKT